MTKMSILPALLIVVLSSAGANAGGYDFRGFDSNRPNVGDKAPMPDGFDETGVRIGLDSLLDSCHLVVVFGALT